MGTPAGGLIDPFDPDGVRFLIDENLAPGVGRALTHVEFNTRSNTDAGLRSADDLDVIEFCGRVGAVWVTQDMDARKRAAYKTRAEALGVSAVFFRLPRAKGMSMKSRFAVLAHWMPWLEEKYEARRPRYFLLNSRGGEPKELAHFADRSARRR